MEKYMSLSYPNGSTLIRMDKETKEVWTNKGSYAIGY